MKKTILAAVIAITLALGVSSAASAASRHRGPAANVHRSQGQSQPARVETRGNQESHRVGRRLPKDPPNYMEQCRKERVKKYNWWKTHGGPRPNPNASPCR